MGLFEFVCDEWICWHHHNTNPGYHVWPMLPQADKQIRLQYSHQIELVLDIQLAVKTPWDKEQSHMKFQIKPLWLTHRFLLKNISFFWQRSVTGGLGSIQAEIMADTAVALTSANVQLVSRKVIGRLCRVSVRWPIFLHYRLIVQGAMWL